MNKFKDTMIEPVYQITYIKKNGETRKIKCKVEPDYCDHLSGKEEYVVVFDLEKEDYRTVNTNTIKSFKLI